MLILQNIIEKVFQEIEEERNLLDDIIVTGKNEKKNI